MKKINFEALELFTDIEKTQSVKQNVKSQLANVIYKRTNGIAMHALALKIYNSKGEEEYTEEECKLIKQVSEQLTPVFIDAINNVIGEQHEDNKK